MAGTEVHIPTAAGPVEAYASSSVVDGQRRPAVVVIHDALGLSAGTREHADRLASYGYVAVAPDLYSRGGFLRCVKATFQSMFNGKGQAYEDIDAVRHWAAARHDCNGRVGIIGFCMGGGFALMTANRGFEVSAPNYGQLPKDVSAALDGACPIVGSYGAKYRTLRGAAAKLEALLDERGIPNDVKEYPGAGHSFMDHLPLPFAVLGKVTGFSFDEASAEDAWNRIRGFFADHLDKSSATT
ncbi:MAG: dienelactone hydrolase family protein [Acidimicrobiales bacterium]